VIAPAAPPVPSTATQKSEDGADPTHETERSPFRSLFTGADQVPLLNGEFEFLAAYTPEVCEHKPVLTISCSPARGMRIQTASWCFYRYTDVPAVEERNYAQFIDGRDI